MEVPKGGQEYKAVEAYFLETLGRDGAQVHGLSRVQSGWSKAQSASTCTVMFHGCRSADNEVSIVRGGFQVSRCVSGGPGYGTWFAYGAQYSDGGFVFADDDGKRHIFVCAVSNADCVSDDRVMRVVKQGRACPLWLLRYSYPDRRSPGRGLSGAQPLGFYVVRDGAWVWEARVGRGAKGSSQRR